MKYSDSDKKSNQLQVMNIKNDMPALSANEPRYDNELLSSKKQYKLEYQL
jgi:hypothetical protein